MTFADLVNKIAWFVDTAIIPFLYSIAFVVFIYGVYHFFFTGGEENRTKGKKYVVWGLLGFVVLFSVWSIVNILIQSVF